MPKIAVAGVLLFLCAGVLFELYLQFKYRRYLKLKRRKILVKVSSKEDEKKYSQDLITTHANVNHPIGYALIPNSRAEFSYRSIFSAPFMVNVNSHGIREDEITPATIEAEDFSCIFLGDSVTFGSGVSLGNTFVKQSQLFLRKNGLRAFCLNFGVGGYSILENLLSVSYRNALSYKPKYIILNFTIKSIFDAPRMNDPLTGYHMLSHQRSFLIHKLHIITRGGKVPFLYNRLRKFQRWCDIKEISFAIHLLPALYQGEILSLQTKNQFSTPKYSEALDLMQLIIENKEFSVWDFSWEFCSTINFKKLFRTGVNGEYAEYQVHFSKEGSSLLGKLIADKIIKSMRTDLQSHSEK